MRKFAKIDANQKEIVTSLRKLGYSVAITSSLGSGFPDIVVGKKHNYLFEIKDALKSPSQKKLTKDESVFQTNWQGQYHVVETLEEILKIINHGSINTKKSNGTALAVSRCLCGNTK